ncbi:MAG: hypothetical protein CMP59_00555, partial [Flavobacteriales bacterium]|nr:hypothetical protein [Flavobacteriales bacterium]
YFFTAFRSTWPKPKVKNKSHRESFAGRIPAALFKVVGGQCPPKPKKHNENKNALRAETASQGVSLLRF